MAGNSSPEHEDHHDNTIQQHPTWVPQTQKPTSRRRLLLWLIRAGFVAFVAAFAIPAVALKTLRLQLKNVAIGDQLVYATGSQEGSLIDSTNVGVGIAVHAFPKGKSDDPNNLVEIVHLSDSDSEFVAFSAICTHLGCSVFTKLTTKGYIPCPCPGSIFNPADGAAVVSGPAGRPLPSLPIQIQSDGSIVVTGPFSGKIGPD